MSLLKALSILLAVNVITAFAEAKSPIDHGELAGIVAAEPNFHGAVIVIDQGEIVLRTGGGFANDAGGVRASPETVFNLGSIAKPFTATAVFHLARTGALTVDDRLDAHLAGVPADKAAITLRQLLTHTSCLPDQHAQSDAEPLTKAEALARITNMRLQCRPGRRYKYSNAGYTLLAAVIESVSGQDYFSYMQQRIFFPAGMRSTGFYCDAHLAGAPAANAYLNGRDQGPVNAFPGPYWSIAGNGEALSTVDDLATWATLMFEGDPRALTDMEQAIAAERLVRDGDGWAGLGWSLRDSPLGPVVWHNGAGAGGNAHFALYPDRRAAIIVLSNRIGYRTVLGVPISLDLPASRLAGRLEARMGRQKE